jgi:hypothetical protein
MISLEGVLRRSVLLEPEEIKWLVFRIDSKTMRMLPKSIDGMLFEFLISADQKADFRESTNGQDPRVTSVGVCGFMVCAGGDVNARLSFIESVALNDLKGLTLMASREGSVSE